MLMSTITDDLINHISAKEIISMLAPIIDGGGGGKDLIATAGGKNKDKLDNALKESKRIVESLLNG